MQEKRAGLQWVVVDISYTASPERISAAQEAHIAFVKEGFADGVFIASGPKTSGLGGVIIAVTRDLSYLDRRLTKDPYRDLGLAEYALTPFEAAMTIPELSV